MKYYLLRFNDDLREVGKQPQAPSVKLLEYNTNDLGDETIEVPLIPPEPIMQNKAKPTTILNVVALSSAYYLVCKKYFIDLLKNFNINTFNSWPLNIYHKKNLLNDYCLYHLDCPSDNQIINFQESVFFIGKLDDWRFEGRTIKVSDYQNYLNTKGVLEKEGLSIKMSNLVLDFRNTDKDLLRLSINSFIRGYFVSERLKKAIEEQRYTGMAFEEIEEYDDRIEVRYTDQGPWPRAAYCWP